MQRLWVVEDSSFGRVLVSRAIAALGLNLQVGFFDHQDHLPDCESGDVVIFSEALLDEETQRRILDFRRDNPTVPMVVLSSDIRTAAVTAMQDAGVQHVPKPLNPLKLSMLVRRAAVRGAS